jgi:hypothetical protein
MTEKWGGGCRKTDSKWKILANHRAATSRLAVPHTTPGGAIAQMWFQQGDVTALLGPGYQQQIG